MLQTTIINMEKSPESRVTDFTQEDKTPILEQYDVVKHRMHPASNYKNSRACMRGKA